MVPIDSGLYGDLHPLGIVVRYGVHRFLDGIEHGTAMFAHCYVSCMTGELLILGGERVAILVVMTMSGSCP